MPTPTPDSIVMTGHQGPEVAAGDLLVTINGVQKRLADWMASQPAATAATLNAAGLANCLTDLAARAAGVPIGGLYRTGNAVMVRLA